MLGKINFVPERVGKHEKGIVPETNGLFVNFEVLMVDSLLEVHYEDHTLPSGSINQRRALLM
jgi:hypothetical protein